MTVRIDSWTHRVYRWITPLLDPLRVARGFSGLAWYARDLRAYRRMGGDDVAWRDLWPTVHERTATSGIDAHYFFLNGWAARRVVSAAPRRHVDVGSQTGFVNVLAAAVPTVFVDYRPLKARQSSLVPMAGDLLRLPFADASVSSLSCLHVIEHVGLGRYGDPLDTRGSRRAAAELARVLAPGGQLLVGLPVGMPRTCFNAHRIHDPRSVPELFPGLTLQEFSAVTDDGQFIENVRPETVAQAQYACGCYRLTRLTTS